MNQKLAYTLCLGGIVIACYLVAEIIGDAQTWTILSTPQAIAHAARILGAVALAIAGALGINLSTLLNGVSRVINNAAQPKD